LPRLKPVETGVARSAPQAQKIVLIPCGCRPGVSPRCIATISLGSSGLMAEHATTAGAATLWVFVPVDTKALEKESRRGALCYLLRVRRVGHLQSRQETR
jgi:hypothetical protein